MDLNIANETNENDESILNCLVRGVTSQSRIRWFKDGELINLNNPFKTFKHKTTLTENNLMKSTLTIPNSVDLDSGSVTCAVSDKNYELKKSIYLHLNKRPEVVLSPQSITTNFKETVTIDCYANTRDAINSSNLTFSYNWRNSTGFINQLDRDQMIQDLYPTGSRLTILNITKPTEYSCHAYNLLGFSSKSIFVDVVGGNDSDDRPKGKIEILFK